MFGLNYRDISFIENIKFDINKRYLVGYGGNKVFILNLKTKNHEIFENNNRLFSKICDLNLVSKSDENRDYVCYIASQRKEVKQIAIFDLIEDYRIREEK